MNILVTGSEGQLGQTILSLSSHFNNHKLFFCHSGSANLQDIHEINQLVSEHQIQAIINCSGYTNVDGATAEKALAYAKNSIQVKNLAQVCQQYEIPLVNYSTDYVFDGAQNTPYAETDEPSPQSDYAKSKYEADKYMLNHFDFGYVIRTSWIYSSNGKNFLNTILDLEGTQTPLKFVIDQVGTPTRATDLAMVTLQVIENKIPYGLYNFSNEGVTSWYDFASLINSTAGLGLNILPVSTEEYRATKPNQAVRPHYSVLDKSLIKQTLDIDIKSWIEAFYDEASQIGL